MRRATWIVWLMLALLPMRGWAVAGMGVPASLSMPGPAAMAEAGDHRAMPPCHQAGDEGGSSPSGSTCQSCDACHGALATPPVVVLVAAPPRAVAPPVVEHRDTGRMAVAGLERPPRSDLA